MLSYQEAEAWCNSLTLEAAREWALAHPFVFRGKEYTYLISTSYPNTLFELLRGERCVEVPIIYEIIKEYKPEEILEVGNVMSHWYPVSHDIVDKYEVAPGVMNIDIVDYNPEKRYKLIICISTLEHIGKDDEPMKPKKSKEALEKMKSLLALGGKLVVTWPIGENKVLDEMVIIREIEFNELYGLKRIEFFEWVEADFEEIKNCSYGSPYPYGNAVGIGVIRR